MIVFSSLSPRERNRLIANLAPMLHKAGVACFSGQANVRIVKIVSDQISQGLLGRRSASPPSPRNTARRGWPRIYRH
jgi:hypothetical protein